MELTMEKEKTWCELVKLYQKNVNVATFTTLLYVTLHITNTCFFCTIYEKDSEGKLNLWIIKTTKGSFRTVSSYFYKEVEKLLEKTNLNDKFGWIYC